MFHCRSVNSYLCLLLPRKQHSLTPPWSGAGFSLFAQPTQKPGVKGCWLNTYTLTHTRTSIQFVTHLDFLCQLECFLLREGDILQGHRFKFNTGAWAEEATLEGLDLKCGESGRKRSGGGRAESSNRDHNGLQGSMSPWNYIYYCVCVCVVWVCVCTCMPLYTHMYVGADHRNVLQWLKKTRDSFVIYHSSGFPTFVCFQCKWTTWCRSRIERVPKEWD